MGAGDVRCRGLGYQVGGVQGVGCTWVLGYQVGGV